jgi:PIN domain nuclease of toxin-antitoxin system
MNVLLDTQVFIWLDSDPARLSATAGRRINDPASRLLLSVASVWEMVIKVGTGKLTLRADVETVVHDQTTRNPITLLPVDIAEAYAVGRLPPIHRDPFDRMLVAQAIVLNAVLLTADATVRQYPVQTDW